MKASRSCASASSWLWAFLLCTVSGGCTSCPPTWLDAPPSVPGWLFASGQCGEVFVDADATSLALSRAARRLADDLDLVVEQRLSVRQLDGRLFVEVADDEGLVHALEGLELVELVHCNGTVYALLRLPAEA
jgi:hypothetical protein